MSFINIPSEIDIPALAAGGGMRRFLQEAGKSQVAMAAVEIQGRMTEEETFPSGVQFALIAGTIDGKLMLRVA